MRPAISKAHDPRQYSSKAAAAAALGAPNAVLEAKSTQKDKRATTAELLHQLAQQPQLEDFEALFANHAEHPHRDPIEIPPILGKMGIPFNI